MYLLIDNYDSFTYNLYAFCKICGMDVKVIKNDEKLLKNSFKGIIISPGPSNPSNSGNSLEYIEKYSKRIPILGVCLGLQCIGYFLGYKIIKAKTILHGRIDTIKILKEKVLFKSIDRDFNVVRYHSLVVDIPTNSYLSTAISNSDNEIMAIEDLENFLFGVQFHPESYLNEYGLKIINNFKNFCEKGV